LRNLQPSKPQLGFFVRRSRRPWPALALSAFAWIAGCDSGGGSGGSSGSEQVTIRYAGDKSAYGLFIEGSVAEASANTKPMATDSCTMSEVATTAGCTSSVATSAEGVTLALSGCFVEPGDELFHCELSSGIVRALRSDPTVHAGCGCQACPSAPAIAVCDSNVTECEASPLVAANVSRSPRPDSVATSRRGTGETTCSTCCETDYFEDEIGTVVSDEVLSEVAFIVTFSEECAFDFNGAAECDLLDRVYDDWTVQNFGDGGIVKRFCFAGRAAGQDALSVSLVGCRGLIDDITVTRALGADFTPLANVPTIRFE
jgi:hypothetical protein